MAEPTAEQVRKAQEEFEVYLALVEKGKVRLVKDYLDNLRMPKDHSDPTQMGDHVTIGLHTAVQFGQLKICKLLLDRGADVTATDPTGMEGLLGMGSTVLHIAVFSHNNPMFQPRAEHVECAKELLKRGADVSVRDEHGQTPFYQALMHGDLEMVRLFLDHGADVEDRPGRPRDRPSPENFFLSAANASEDCGPRALECAAFQGHEDIVRELLDRGAALDRPNFAMMTPLHNAASKGHLKVVRLLIKRGAAIEAVTSGDGDTPLHKAASDGHVRVVKELLDSGADINKRNGNGRTALYLAALYGYLSVVREILARRPNMDQEEKRHVADTARSNGFGKIAEIVQAHTLMTKKPKDPSLMKQPKEQSLTKKQKDQQLDELVSWISSDEAAKSKKGQKASGSVGDAGPKPEKTKAKKKADQKEDATAADWMWRPSIDQTMGMSLAMLNLTKK